MLISTIQIISLIVLSVPWINGETTHTVTVGLQGSFFDPPNLTAGINDTITFIFAGNLHTVTQSTFDNPCVPLPGGFNSGPAGVGVNPYAPPPIWTLRITNVSQPIWFFCEITRPSSHCAAGMVGAINPPNMSIFNNFMSAAKQVTSNRATPTINLSGPGAFATVSPRISSRTVKPPATISGSSDSFSNSIGPQAMNTDKTDPKISAIIGGTIGGTVFIILIGIALFVSRRRRRGLKENGGPEVTPFNTNAAINAYPNSNHWIQTSHTSGPTSPTKFYFQPSRKQLEGQDALPNVTIPPYTRDEHAAPQMDYLNRVPSSTPSPLQMGFNRQPSYSSMRSETVAIPSGGARSNFAAQIQCSDPYNSGSSYLSPSSIKVIADEVASILLRKLSVPSIAVKTYEGLEKGVTFHNVSSSMSGHDESKSTRCLTPARSIGFGRAEKDVRVEDYVADEGEAGGCSNVCINDIAPPRYYRKSIAS